MHKPIPEIRKAFLDFFRSKGHSIVSSASLIPENDPTTLFTGAGMQPMLSYLLGETHPLGPRIADSQKCFRAQDIEEVGDSRHTTFFEMLGNWSMGDFFKREQIGWMFEFLTDVIGLDPSRIFITVFRGSQKWNIPRDEESVGIWQARFAMKGIAAEDVDFSEKSGMQGGRIFYYDETKNWWSRAGVPAQMPTGEPGGASSEMFWDFGEDLGLHEASAWKNQPCHVNCDCGRFMEIGNNVFMEYLRTEDGFAPLAQKNVDFGGGLERIAAAAADNPDVFRTSAFTAPINALEHLSGRAYGDDPVVTRAFRIIADHVRAATFIIGDPQGVTPSNVGQGYVVRRLLRRAIREGRRLGIQDPFLPKISSVVIGEFGVSYSELEKNRQKILNEISAEEEKFSVTLEKGERELKKMMDHGVVSGKDAFVLFSTFGFPFELTAEMIREAGANVDEAAFHEEFRKHQDISRSAAAGTFKGGLADHSEETTRLHTATHLLHRALKNVLGDDVEQKGSNITKERLRFDFSWPEKLTDEQKKAVEDIVNNVIQKNVPVRYEEMTVKEAKEKGAIGLFGEKYGEKVKVYMIGDEVADFSREICGGPHVKRTGEIGSFKITKEESASAGIRRIKATVTGPGV